MYENVYEIMVESGIAEVVEEAIQHELNGSKVEGGLFIMPKNVGDSAAPAVATTDIHFTVLPFMSGTGEPVLCTNIFKVSII